jgi:hypothetical protein
VNNATLFSFVKTKMVQLLKMPGGIFAVSVILTMLFIFIDSRITGHKKNYGYYLKYGLFVGSMNAFLFSLSNGIWPSMPQMGGGIVSSSATVSGSPIMTGLPDFF